MSDRQYLADARKRYQSLETERRPYLDRARQAAQYTIPHLFPPEGTSAYTDLQDPWSSIGARAVNNLAGKLVVGLVPPSRLFYRLLPTSEAETELAEAEKLDPKARTDVELALSRVEQEMLRELGRARAQPSVFEALRQLPVGGNALLLLDKDSTRTFKLGDYVVRRAYSGEVLELIFKEQVPWSEMPEDWQKECIENPAPDQEELPEDPDDAVIDVYTRWERQPNKSWRYYQDARGAVVPGTIGTHGKRKPLPWMALRWSHIDGEHYGRSYCDEYMGDLRTVEGLSKAITEAAAQGSKIIYFIKPGAYTNPRDLEEAESGEFVVGQREEVELLSHDAKAYDLSQAAALLQEVTRRLELGFLLATAVQRDAERVTAAEFKRMIDELQQGLGGPFSVLAEDLQRPLAELLLHRVAETFPAASRLPRDVETSLVTGVDALGRSAEFEALHTALVSAAQIIGPEAVAREVNGEEVVRRALAATGTRVDGLLKTGEQKQQEAQAQQAQTLLEQTAGPVAANVTKDPNG